MDGLKNSVRVLLRPSDEIKLILELTSTSNNDQTQNGVNVVPEAPLNSRDASDSRHKRIVAVVTHKDETNGREEGSLFILKRKLFSPATITELEVHRVFPIYGDFMITMAQMQRESSDLGGLSNLRQQPRTKFKVTINPGNIMIGHEPLDLMTDDLQGLKTVLAECRRLKELSELVPEASSPTQTYSWLAAYTTNNVYIPSLTSSFPDLRDLHKPLQTRLSSASAAGIPGDNEINDIVVIRDDWARTRSRNQCRKGRGRLNIRLGTFNVNGKTPSQDLAVWVRGSNAKEHAGSTTHHGLLPAVKEISPLSMGELATNPLDSAEITKHPHSPTFSSISYSSTASTGGLRDPSSASTFSFANASIGSSSTFTLAPSTSELIDNPASKAELASKTSLPAITVPQDAPKVPTIQISEDSSSEPDLLAIGFQELDLSTEALLYSTSTVREDAWTVAIFAALGEKAEMYEKLASKQLVGMLIIIIVKKSLNPCFSSVMSSAVGSGIMGVMGNKGGTAIRLSFTPPTSRLDALDSALDAAFDPENQKAHHHGIETPGTTVITFVVSHLAAFDEMVDKRNSDYHDLVKRLSFDSSASAVASGARAATGGKRASIGVTGAGADESLNATMPGGPAHSPTFAVTEKFGVFESDVVFWMGDLNYRIDLPDTDVRTLLHSENWKDKFNILLQFDQLQTAIRNKKAFEFFHEHELDHLPTYRFGSGIATDELGYDTKRRPAWTDRILSASSSTAQVNQLSYTGHPEISFSDHRPVSANFTVDMDLYDKDHLHATATNLFRQVQGMEDMQERVKAKLSQTSIDLGDIFYMKRVEKIVTFRNCGKVPFAFRLVPVEMHGESYPEWLSVSPETGLLLPNELLEITLSAFVDNKIASRLNLGPRVLECTLILHTIMGKDHFVAVSAEYQYTCFANKLSRLTLLPGPIRTIKSHNDLLSEDRAMNAPQEIMRLVNWLTTSAHLADDLFFSEPDSEIVGDICEHLDTGLDFPYPHETKDRSISIAFGDALVRFLNSLPDSIVPRELHGRCVAAGNRDEAFEILDSFPPEAVNVWISVTAFLHYLVQSSTVPEIRAEKIAAIFAPVFFGFLRDDYTAATTLVSAISPLGYQSFIKYFIQ